MKTFIFLSLFASLLLPHPIHARSEAEQQLEANRLFNAPTALLQFNQSLGMYDNFQWPPSLIAAPTGLYLRLLNDLISPSGLTGNGSLLDYGNAQVLYQVPFDLVGFDGAPLYDPASGSIFGFDERSILCLDSRTGQLKWFQNVSMTFDGAIVAGDKVIVEVWPVAQMEYYQAFDIQTGKQVYEYVFNGGANSNWFLQSDARQTVVATYEGWYSLFDPVKANFTEWTSIGCPQYGPQVSAQTAFVNGVFYGCSSDNFGNTSLQGWDLRNGCALVLNMTIDSNSGVCPYFISTYVPQDILVDNVEKPTTAFLALQSPPSLVAIDLQTQTQKWIVNLPNTTVAPGTAGNQTTMAMYPCITADGIIWFYQGFQYTGENLYNIGVLALAVDSVSGSILADFAIDYVQFDAAPVCGGPNSMAYVLLENMLDPWPSNSSSQMPNGFKSPGYLLGLQVPPRQSNEDATNEQIASM